MIQPNFYNVNIDTPLSLANNTDLWNDRLLGQLYSKTNGAIYLMEVPYHHLSQAEHIWRVVDIGFVQEDGIMSYFKAYDIDGRMLPEAAFGVTWDTSKHSISGGFKFQPATRSQYVPVQNNFPTPNSGGYRVQVLDKNNPSEQLAFGLFKQDGHKGVVISFRLFELGTNYPNDIYMRIR